MSRVALAGLPLHAYGPNPPGLIHRLLLRPFDHGPRKGIHRSGDSVNPGGTRRSLRLREHQIIILFLRRQTTRIPPQNRMAAMMQLPLATDSRSFFEGSERVIIPWRISTH